ncbi:hypothetical protein Tco_1446134 [Tanacetum coccineum]
MEALIEYESVMDKGVTETDKDHKRKHDDDEDDDDEDPPTGPNQCKAPSKGSKTGKSSLAKEPVEEPIAKVVMDDAGDDVAHEDNQPQDASKPKTAKTSNQDWFKQPPRPPTPDPEWNKRQYVLNGLKIENLTQDILLGPAFSLLKGTCSSSIELEYNFQECFNALIDKLDWNNPEGDRYPFDLSKSLPLQGPQVTYTSFIKKTKATLYEIKGIEDMVPTLWSTIKHAYDKDSEKGIKHWGERRKLWYRSQVSKFNKHNVYSTKAILGVKSVSVKKLHGYGHLEEIVVKRFDQQFYKFKEGDFVDLHLNNIEDMLLLVVQHKLFHLEGSVIIDFIVALQIEFKEPYTPSYDPPGIVYEDLNKQKRVLRADELYKFSDGTLKSVRDEIHHKVLDFLLDYNTEMPKRKWTVVDRKRSGLMIELIDKKLREREIIKNLERLVGARELEMEYKLMTRTV